MSIPIVPSTNAAHAASDYAVAAISGTTVLGGTALSCIYLNNLLKNWTDFSWEQRGVRAVGLLGGLLITSVSLAAIFTIFISPEIDLLNRQVTTVSK